MSDTMKKILWTAGIALAVAIAYPIIKPYLQKIPVVGSYIS